MDYRIVWSKSALADLRDLIRFIAADDPQTAGRFGERLVSKVEAVSLFPRIGRMVPECRHDALREVIFVPYRIIYEIDDDTQLVSVLRIWHAARGKPELPS